MATNERDPRDTDPPPLDFTAPQIIPPTKGQLAGDGDVEMEIFGPIVTARAVQVKRNPKAIMAELGDLCDQFGELFYYSWEAKGADGKVSTIEGLTTKAANVLMMAWGNCRVDTRCLDKGEYWEFLAQYIDYEKGVTITRPFRQRKAMNLGKRMDAERKMDIQFQIGASKAARNVIDKVLVLQSEFMVERSKNKLLEWVTKNKDKAIENLQRASKQNGVPLERLERYVERKQPEWLPRHLARLLQAFRAISEGVGTVDDIFGTVEAQIDGEGSDDLGGQKSAEPEKTKKDPKPKDPKPKPESKPAEEPKQETAPPAEQKKTEAPPPEKKPEAPAPADDDLAGLNWGDNKENLL